MKISIKRQTNRSTTWKEGANCVNLFLQRDYREASEASFEMGLRTTEWGNKEEITPRVTFEINGKRYEMSIKALGKILKESK